MSILPACHTGVALDDVCVLSLGLLLRVLCAGVSLACRPGGWRPSCHSRRRQQSARPAFAERSAGPSPAPSQGHDSADGPTGAPAARPSPGTRHSLAARQRLSRVWDRVSRDRQDLPEGWPPVPSAVICWGEASCSRTLPQAEGTPQEPGTRRQGPPPTGAPFALVGHLQRLTGLQLVPRLGVGTRAPEDHGAAALGCRDLGVAESSP